jgi:hypothetical protein
LAFFSDRRILLGGLPPFWVGKILSNRFFSMDGFFELYDGLGGRRGASLIGPGAFFERRIFVGGLIFSATIRVFGSEKSWGQPIFFDGGFFGAFRLGRENRGLSWLNRNILSNTTM